MDTIFILLFLVSSFAIFIFAILGLINMRKDKLKAKKRLKGAGASIAISLVSLIGFIATAEEVEPTEQTTPVGAETDKQKEPTKSDADLKVEAEAKKAAEEKEKADKLVAEKEYYLKELDAKVTTQMSEYDTIWNKYWIETFNGVSDGSINVYGAYDNMKSLEQSYDNLYLAFGEIKADGLSKENEKLFKEFISEIQSAATGRAIVAENAQKMFDEGDLSPSKLDKIKQDVAYADGRMMQAAVALTSLKMELGLIEESEETTK